MPTSPTPWVVAHRTTMGHAPENTLQGLGLAAELGADAVEIDVQLTADGVPVLLHDATLDRTTDASGPLLARTADQLRRVDAGGEPIPTLRQVLDELDPRLTLVIECKDAPGQDPHRLARAVLADLRAAPPARPPWLWSFDAALLHALATLPHPYPLAHLCQTPDAGVLKRARSLRLAAVSLHAGDADADLVDTVRARGHVAFVWTANDPTRLRALAALPLAGIVTDFPERAREALAAPTPDPAGA
jgi:glycerophosphoryl diester phosphodiesterase